LLEERSNGSISHESPERQGVQRVQLVDHPASLLPRRDPERPVHGSSLGGLPAGRDPLWRRQEIRRRLIVARHPHPVSAIRPTEQSAAVDGLRIGAHVRDWRSIGWEHSRLMAEA
jgi:hypothetical protein